jgi:hypothetical protein
MKLVHVPLALLLVTCAACGSTPAPATTEVPGADSSSAPPDPEVPSPAAAPCPEGSPDCAAPTP